jgi:hypothetical protein
MSKKMCFDAEATAPTQQYRGQWAQWDWSDKGPGQWHGIASIGAGHAHIGETKEKMPVVRLACTRVRVLPSRIREEPEAGEPVCPECRDLDELGKRLRTQEDAPVKEPVTA